MRRFKTGDLVVHVDDDNDVGVVIRIELDNYVNEAPKHKEIVVLWSNGEIMYHGSGYYLEVVCK